jgi:hypothetical protein
LVFGVEWHIRCGEGDEFLRRNVALTVPGVRPEIYKNMKNVVCFEWLEGMWKCFNKGVHVLDAMQSLRNYILNIELAVLG